MAKAYRSWILINSDWTSILIHSALQDKRFPKRNLPLVVRASEEVEATDTEEAVVGVGCKVVVGSLGEVVPTLLRFRSFEQVIASKTLASLEGLPEPLRKRPARSENLGMEGIALLFVVVVV